MISDRCLHHEIHYSYSAIPILHKIETPKNGRNFLFDCSKPPTWSSLRKHQSMSHCYPCHPYHLHCYPSSFALAIAIFPFAVMVMDPIERRWDLGRRGGLDLACHHRPVIGRRGDLDRYLFHCLSLSLELSTLPSPPSPPPYPLSDIIPIIRNSMLRMLEWSANVVPSSLEPSPSSQHFTITGHRDSCRKQREGQ